MDNNNSFNNLRPPSPTPSFVSTASFSNNNNSYHPRNNNSNNNVNNGSGSNRQSTMGKFVLRLEQQEKEIVGLKATCNRLFEKCEGLEKWKNGVGKWLVEYFGDNFVLPETRDVDVQTENENEEGEGYRDFSPPPCTSPPPNSSQRSYSSCSGLNLVIQNVRSIQSDEGPEKQVQMNGISADGDRNRTSFQDENNEEEMEEESPPSKRPRTNEGQEEQDKEREGDGEGEGIPAHPNDGGEEREPASPASSDKTTVVPRRSIGEVDVVGTDSAVAGSSSETNAVCAENEEASSYSGNDNDVIMDAEDESTIIRKPEDVVRTVQIPGDMLSGSKPESCRSQAGSGSGSQRLPIDDDAPCAVCGDPWEEENNCIIFCDKCNVPVHQACYGVQTIPPGSWECNPCKQKLDTKKLNCRFCPVLGGALKPVHSPSKCWGHVYCAWWIPELRMGSRRTQEPILGLTGIPQSRWKLKCSICKKPNCGAPIQCYDKRCKKAYHSTCGQAAGYYMNMQSTGAGNYDLVVETFCKKHEKKVKQPK